MIRSDFGSRGTLGSSCQNRFWLPQYLMSGPSQVAMDFSTPAFGTGTISPGKRGRRESMVVTGLSPNRKESKIDMVPDSGNSILLEMRSMMYSMTDTLNGIKTRLDSVESKLTSVTGTVGELQSSVENIKTDVAFNGNSVKHLMDMVNQLQVSGVKTNAVVTGYPKEVPSEIRIGHFSGLSKVPKDNTVRCQLKGATPGPPPNVRNAATENRDFETVDHQKHVPKHVFGVECQLKGATFDTGRGCRGTPSGLL